MSEIIKDPVILYEDNHIVVLVKPANMLVQGDSTGDPDVLSWLKQYIKEKYNKPGEAFIGLVHRMDRPVGGLLVFARTSKAASRLSEQVRTHELCREYVCVCQGDAPDRFTLHDWLQKDEAANKVKVIPSYLKLQGKEADSYWFPDATRYIGYNPDVPDKTIHEFPCYSFVLGDLHAHVVNVMFVLFLVGLLYAWMRSVRMREAVIMKPDRKQFWKKQLLIPHILLAAVMIGMFRFTNFWDFIIYFVVTGGVVLFTNIVQFDGKVKRILAVTAVQAVEIIVISYVVSLPFTLQFDSMFKGVGIAQNHSMIHQLLILWGLPVVLTVLLIICIIWEKLRGGANRSLYRLMKAISVPDLFAIVMGLCAIGLVLIPELVYVRDIYESGNARANTMFKLTYQAYIMFGLTMIYAIFRLLIIGKNKILKALALIGLILFVWTCGYFGNSVHAWFGKVWKPSEYKGLNATAFLETDFSEDVGGIKWLKENVKDVEVVLEANGDSYSEYERVSAMTGLPTIMGWYVHEWLWRDDTADLNEKSADIESIYTSLDAEYVKELLEEYDVSYIFVGSKEREKYGDALNEEVLNSLGEVVFQDEVYSTYILKINK